MLLYDLLRSLPGRIDLAGVPNLQITGVCEDSRLTRPGDLFVARSGTRNDGSAFLLDAQSRGAVAAIVGTKTSDNTLPQVVFSNNSAASILANTLAGRPDHQVKVVGITGTNGKTTTAYLLRHLLTRVAPSESHGRAAGLSTAVPFASGGRCGLIGTVEIDDGRKSVEASMTTPSACDIAGLLATMRDNQCRACAMEVSSHALDQGRTAGVRFVAGVFTNLTGDHLDYHKSMDAYAGAKARLFASLASDSVAVINGASPYAGRMIEGCDARIVRFGLTADCDYRAADVLTTSAGSKFVLHTPDGVAEASSPMIGRHNIENILGAAAVAGECFGLTVHQIVAALRDAIGAPGRLQPVRGGQPFAVFVDYAHTDDGLENVLRSLRPVTRGKLRVLFGCGGDRDRTKRPRMAATAERLADVLYVTSDNPRTESPTSIVEEVLTGLSTEGRNRAVVEPDRREAIRSIIADAQPGDVVLLAGKGHENYQIIGTEKRHFDDVEEATAAIGAVAV